MPNKMRVGLGVSVGHTHFSHHTSPTTLVSVTCEDSAGVKKLVAMNLVIL